MPRTQTVCLQLVAGGNHPASQVNPVVLEISGDLDLYSVPRLRNALIELHQAGQTLVIMDMAALEFMDSNGLGVLIGGAKQARAAGGCVVLVAVPEKVLKVLRITGVIRVLPVFGTVPEAIAHLDEAYR